MCEELTKLKDFHKDVQHTIYESLNHASDFILKEGQRTCQESRLIDGMIDDIEDKDTELENLKVLLGVAEKRPLRYQPLADDPIDLAMADYINNRK
mmetsp:Transcript_21544/g.3517  ORF Transcript_21544/g.3517 Transcript_21544/m.3517 type:complete len:96 (+) Transcript_21544:356-643(+)